MGSGSDEAHPSIAFLIFLAIIPVAFICRPFAKIFDSSWFVPTGLSLDRFVTIMCSKMAAVDEDEHIRQMFLAFDMQCKIFNCPTVYSISEAGLNLYL